MILTQITQHLKKKKNNELNNERHDEILQLSEKINYDDITYH